MFATHTQRAAHIDAVYAEVGQLMRQRTTAQWRTLLDAADVPNMPMASPEDLLQDPHHQATGFVRTLDHPTEGPIKTTGLPRNGSRRRPPPNPAPHPQLGEHTATVLLRLGYSNEEIAAMQDQRRLSPGGLCGGLIKEMNMSRYLVREKDVPGLQPCQPPRHGEQALGQPRPM